MGSVVSEAPAQIAINYSQGVDPKLSVIEVQDASGKRLDKGDVHVSSGDDKWLYVSLPPLTSGTYKVIWRATSSTSHLTQGRYEFVVSPPR